MVDDETVIQAAVYRAHSTDPPLGAMAFCADEPTASGARSANLGASLDELIVNTIHGPRGVVSTSGLHACTSRVVVGGSHSDR